MANNEGQYKAVSALKLKHFHCFNLEGWERIA